MFKTFCFINYIVKLINIGSITGILFIQNQIIEKKIFKFKFYKN